MPLKQRNQRNLYASTLYTMHLYWDFSLKGTSCLINAVAFRGLNILFIFEVFGVTFIDQPPELQYKYRNKNNIYIYIYNVTPSARMSLTLSHHPSLSSIASGRYSGQHPVQAQSCYIQVLAGRPVFACPCEGVHRSKSLMNSSLLLQQCPICLVRLTWIVFMMAGKWPHSCCFVWCCLQDLFNIARSILVQLPSSFFSIRLVSVYVVHYIYIYIISHNIVLQT